MPRSLLITSLLALAACATAPPASAPTPVPRASTAASQVFQSLPPPRFPSPRMATEAPAAVPHAAGTTTVSGLVTADSGNPLYGAGVSIQSLDPEVPYSERVIAEKGRFSISGVPVGVMVKVAANIRFYEPRSLMLTTSAEPAANVVEFAGPYALRKR